MKPKRFWINKFLIFTLLCMAGVILTVVLIEALVLPLLSWIFLDEWQWSPIKEWLRLCVLGAIVGAVASVFFTNYAWLVHAKATLLRKAIVTLLVVAACIFIAVAARGYAGQLLPG